jgi:HAMP domain-containing protein
MATSFKGELLNAYHNFSATNPARTVNTADSFKAALYLASATMNAASTAYTATGEVTGAGYTAGGVAITAWNAPTTSGTTGFTTPTASITYTSVTLTTAFDAVLIYNSSQSNRAVSVHTFGSQTVTAGTFTLTMPANAAATALIRLA